MIMIQLKIWINLVLLFHFVIYFRQERKAVRSLRFQLSAFWRRISYYEEIELSFSIFDNISISDTQRDHNSDVVLWSCRIIIWILFIVVQVIKSLISRS